MEQVVTIALHGLIDQLRTVRGEIARTPRGTRFERVEEGWDPIHGLHQG